MSNLELSLLNSITNERCFSSAVFTTFNFDIDFFEKHVFSQLKQGKCLKTFLFVDNKQFMESIKACHSNARPGIDYFVQPVNIDGSFHPKMVLLVGEDKLRLIVGSANLTSSGYQTNREIFQFFDYSLKQPENASLFRSAIEFIENLNNDYNDFGINLNKECLDTARKLLNEVESEDKWLLTNYKSSMIYQLSKIINEDINQIDIAVPFYDSELSVLNEFKKLYPNAKINLFVQDLYSTFPKDKVFDSNINDFVVFKRVLKGSISHFYHGKVFRFVSNSNSYILYGSANCTASAMLRNRNNHGNVEMSILEKGTTDEFNDFFNSFKPIDNFDKNNLVSCQYPKDECVVEPVRFVKGWVEDSSIFIQIYVSSSIDSDDVHFDECEVDSYNTETRIYTIKVDKSDNISSLLTINVSIGFDDFPVRCWYFDSKSLTNAWNRTITSYLRDYDININEGENYIAQQRKLIDLISKNLSIEVTSITNADNSNHDDSDEDDDDDSDETEELDIQTSVKTTIDDNSNYDDQDIFNQIYAHRGLNWMLHPINANGGGQKHESGGQHKITASPTEPKSNQTPNNHFDSENYSKFLIEALKNIEGSKEFEIATSRTLLFIYSLIDADLFNFCFENYFKKTDGEKIFELKTKYLKNVLSRKDISNFDGVEKKDVACLVTKVVLDYLSIPKHDPSLINEDIKKIFNDVLCFFPLVEEVDSIIDLVYSWFGKNINKDDFIRFTKKHLPLTKDDFKSYFKKVKLCDDPIIRIEDNTINIEALTSDVAKCLSIDAETFGYSLAKTIIDYVNYYFVTSFTVQDSNINLVFVTLETNAVVQSVSYTFGGYGNQNSKRTLKDGTVIVDGKPKKIFGY